MSEKLERHKKLSDKLEQVCKEMMESEGVFSAWLVPRCPKCNGVLSQYAGTPKLVCVKCKSIWALGWCRKD